MSRIAFLFPGQGAQKVGMGRRLAESLPSVRDLYDRAAAVLGYDLAELCFEGPAEKLDSTVCSQPALFVTSLAALESLRAESPDVVLSCEAAAGLSLGEYTAMVLAGVMEFEDGLALVQKRGAAMQEASDATLGGMVSILGLERVEVERLCREAADGETEAGDLPEWASGLRGRFAAALDDDLNISGAMAALFDTVHAGNKAMAEVPTSGNCTLTLRQGQEFEFHATLDEFKKQDTNYRSMKLDIKALVLSKKK